MHRLGLLLLFFSSYLSIAAQECAISVPATIIDEKTGMFVAGIAPGMLHAKIGNAFVPVTTIERIKSMRIVILFDQSGSMDGQDKPFDYTQAAMRRIQETLINELFPQLPPDAQVLIGAFHQEIAFGDQFSRDPQELQKMFADVSARLKRRGIRKTSLFDAVRQAIQRFGDVQAGDAIVLITDGIDNNSKIKGKVLLQELAGRPVRVFTALFLGPSPTFLPGFPESADWVQRLADDTGGSIYRINAANSLWTKEKWSATAHENLARFWTEEVLSVYSLHFLLPVGTKRNQKWLLGVNSAANTGKRVSALFPLHVGPCPATTAAR